jgi:ribosomal protein S12 methylthiotransferase
VKAGVKELLVISQDTSAYGVDIKYATSPWKGQPLPARFLDLATALGELGVWVRLHYVYPYPHVDAVMPLMASGKILPYLDIPFQHAAPNVLKAMKRPAHGEKTLERIHRWRQEVPQLGIRSTFIVGFPGETESDFQLLLDWLKEAKLTRVGCFKYEAVAGARANELPGAVPEEVKEERWHRFMQAQAKISTVLMDNRVGEEIDVIIDTVDDAGAVGRSMWDAPEIDGSVRLEDETEVKPGDIVRVKVVDAEAYDLFAERV